MVNEEATIITSRKGFWAVLLVQLVFCVGLVCLHECLPLATGEVVYYGSFVSARIDVITRYK